MYSKGEKNIIMKTEGFWEGTMDKLRWIHLSDIHFSGDEDYEVTRMRDSIADKLKELIDGKIINFVVVSGDLVYRNGSYDAKLKKFIESVEHICNVSSDNLFIVPGNHDIKRNQARTVLLDGIRKENFKFEKDTVEQLEKDFKKYKNFFKKVKLQDEDYLYKVEKREEYNVFLMNTAFTAGTDQDEGKLVLEKNLFYDAIKQLKDQECSINIAVGHHPIACFLKENQEKIWNNFNDYNIDFYLCGHQHKGAYSYDLNAGRVIPTYQCGSGRVDDYATVTFLMGELDMNTKKGKITPYKWLVNEECWTIGGIDGRRAVSGELEITLERFQKSTVSSFEDEEVNEDEFRRFMMEFHEKSKYFDNEETNIDPKDVFEKFSNMKCNKSVEKHYHSLCRYFPIIDEIMKSTLLTPIERESIPNIIISEYNKVLGKADNGNEIIELIVENIFQLYKDEFNYSNSILKTYFKILVYWSIYECDIFNEKI